MKNISFVVILCLWCLKVLPQSQNPCLLSTAGDYSESPGFSLAWSVGEPAIETYTNSMFMLSQGFHQPFDPFRFSGVMRYNNLAATPMHQSVAYLKIPGGVSVDSALLNSHGNFYFFHSPAGTYITQGHTSLPWGGGNAQDAQRILMHFVHMTTLYDMYKQAADVTLSNGINAADALMVASRFVGLVDEFALDDWLFSHDTILISNTPQVRDIDALCAGDVNGSHDPSARLMPAVNIIRQGAATYAEGKMLVIPLVADATVTASAISLVLDLPPALTGVVDMIVNTGEGTQLWKVTDGQLRIAWYSLVPVTFTEGSTVISLKIIPDGTREKVNTLPLPLVGQESEFGDEEGVTIPEVSLRFPLLVGEDKEGQSFVECCSPNPAEGSTNLYYQLLQPGTVVISLYDLPGRLLETVMLRQDSPGFHEYALPTGSYPPGYYLIKANLSTSSENHSTAAKISIVK